MAVKRAKNGLNLFHEMSMDVPAYKDFLRKNKFDPLRVKTIEDLKNVPIINKDNYLRRYPRQDFAGMGSLLKGVGLLAPLLALLENHFIFLGQIYKMNTMR